jgi:cytochrome b subunit of formate dehydrogenase
MVSKQRINYWIDVGLVITFICSLVTGVIKFPKLFAMLELSYSSFPMYEISQVHDWSGITMAVLVLAHIILHFDWMVLMTKGLFKKKGKNA